MGNSIEGSFKGSKKGFQSLIKMTNPLLRNNSHQLEGSHQIELLSLNN